MQIAVHGTVCMLNCGHTMHEVHLKCITDCATLKRTYRDVHIKNKVFIGRERKIKGF